MREYTTEPEDAVTRTWTTIGLLTAVGMLWLSTPVGAQYRATRPAPAAPPVVLAPGSPLAARPSSPLVATDSIRALQRPSRNCQWIGPSDDAGPCAWRDHFGPRLLPPMGVERVMLTGVDWFATTSATTAERQGTAAQVQGMHRAMDATRAKIDAEFQTAARRRR